MRTRYLFVLDVRGHSNGNIREEIVVESISDAS